MRRRVRDEDGLRQPSMHSDTDSSVAARRVESYVIEVETEWEDGTPPQPQQPDPLAGGRPRATRQGTQPQPQSYSTLLLGGVSAASPSMVHPSSTFGRVVESEQHMSMGGTGSGSTGAFRSRAGDIGGGHVQHVMSCNLPARGAPGRTGDTPDRSGGSGVDIGNSTATTATSAPTNSSSLTTSMASDPRLRTQAQQPHPSRHPSIPMPSKTTITTTLSGEGYDASAAPSHNTHHGYTSSASATFATPTKDRTYSALDVTTSTNRPPPPPVELGVLSSIASVTKEKKTLLDDMSVPSSLLMDDGGSVRSYSQALEDAVAARYTGENGAHAAGGSDDGLAGVVRKMTAESVRRGREKRGGDDCGGDPPRAVMPAAAESQRQRPTADIDASSLGRTSDGAEPSVLGGSAAGSRAASPWRRGRGVDTGYHGGGGIAVHSIRTSPRRRPGDVHVDALARVAAEQRTAMEMIMDAGLAEHQARQERLLRGPPRFPSSPSERNPGDGGGGAATPSPSVVSRLESALRQADRDMARMKQDLARLESDAIKARNQAEVSRRDAADAHARGQGQRQSLERDNLRLELENKELRRTMEDLRERLAVFEAAAPTRVSTWCQTTASGSAWAACTTDAAPDVLARTQQELAAVKSELAFAVEQRRLAERAGAAILADLHARHGGPGSVEGSADGSSPTATSVSE